jgi:FixJ family two-component response regulator
MLSSSTVHVVDDDELYRHSLRRLLQAGGYAVSTYENAESLMAELKDQPGCVVLDLNLPTLDGEQVQQELGRRGLHLPVVFLTGHGDIQTGVRAIRNGAEDFLTKPVDRQHLFDAVSRALARDAVERRRREQLEALRRRYTTLTLAERTIFAYVVSGLLNKQIAHELGRAERTVKAHRGRVMQKMQANSVPELVRMADALGVSIDEVAKTPDE